MTRLSLCFAVLLAAAACRSAPSSAYLALPQQPAAAENLRLAAPVSTWDEALPLGNGLMGGLLWGEGSTLRLSLDRGDLWDERPAAGLKEDWYKEKNYAWGVERIKAKDYGAVNQAWDGPYNGKTPTKLPGGRLEIELAEGQSLQNFELDLARAEGSADTGKGKLSAFFSAQQPVALIRLPGKPRRVELIPAGSKKQGSGNAGPSSGGAVAALGYPAAAHGSDRHFSWYEQEGALGFRYAVCVGRKEVAGETLLSVAVASTVDGPSPHLHAIVRCSAALEQGYQAAFAEHASWWKDFWAQSSIEFPQGAEAIARQYQIVQYFHGAASRRGAPPMPLQGVWTADNGGLPPWKGDYHNDLNTQMTYIAYQTAGRFDEGACYLDFLWQRRATFEKFARDFYGTPGLACPGVMSLAGQPLGGWGQYSLSPTMSAWSAHLFYLHWRYTRESEFLSGRAYPWCSGVGECMLALLKPGPDGRLVLPLSSSPEIHDNSPRAWLKPNSNYDLMSLKMLFLSLEEMASALGKKDEAQRWAQAAADLGDFHADAGEVLEIDPGQLLPGSHRHLSHLIGLYPFNLVTQEGSDLDRRRIAATLKHWQSLGTRAWVGYSFTWDACLRARTGDAEGALKQLEIFCEAFVTRNGFHVNGDQKKKGYSGFTYRPFTLEGNFLASQVVHEMLLQSWSAKPGSGDEGPIRVFPATPAAWRDLAFRDLRCEGGHKVSARRVAGKTTWLRLEAGKDGVVRIRSDFAAPPRWNRDAVLVDGAWQVELKKGEVLESR
ncbi:MAG: hypothetical protein RL095_3991 [Verrucomicrobiota bacterium]|jgi:alpha-L-fucosidase 2